MELASVVGVRVRDLRTDQGLTQEQLADRADLDCTVLQRIEVGKANPTLSTLNKLAAALGVSPVKLFQQDQGIAREMEALLGMWRNKGPAEVELMLEINRSLARYLEGRSEKNLDQ